MEPEQSAPAADPVEAERDALRRTVAKRSLEVAVQALEGLEVLEDQARHGDSDSLHVVQRWAALLTRLGATKRIHIANGR